MSGEFDGAPLVASTVRGIRRFRVDELGRLRSPQQGTVWRPDDNTAECRRGQQLAAAVTNMSRMFGGGYTVIKPSQESRPLDAPGHSFASCRCGYYAYSDGGDAAEYGGDGTVAAVVEGWGDVMLGTRGFRAQHARVLAVCLPRRREVDGGRARWWVFRPLARWMERHEWSTSTFGVLGLTLGCLAVVFGVHVFTVPQGAPPAWVGWALCVSAPVLLYVVAHGFEVDFGRWNDWKYRRRDVQPPSATSVEALRANYPDVTFYGSYRAMLAAWPPHPGDRPTPTTDPTFWERP